MIHPSLRLPRACPGRVRRSGPWLAIVAHLTLWPVIPLAAQEVVPLHELSDADLATIDLHDTSVGDWQSVLGDATLRSHSFRFFSEGSSLGPEEFDFRIWLAWHDATNRIYCAVEFVDDAFFSPGVNDGFWPFYNMDSYVELHLDGDLSGGRYQLGPQDGQDEDERREFNNRQAQEYNAVGAGAPESHVALISYRAAYPADWFVRPPFADGGGGHFGEQPHVLVTEFYVTPFDIFVWDDPQGSVVSELRPDATIGFAITITDSDPPAEFGPGGWYHYPRAVINSIGDSGAFARGLLVGHTAPEASAPSLGDSSWAHIKSSFRSHRK